MFGTIEILALIAIVMIALKMFVVFFMPKEALKLGKSILKYERAAYYSCFVLAVVILYFLYTAGVRIYEILAVALFLRMLYGMALIPFAKPLYAKLDLKKAVKELWLVYLFALVLLVWALKELFF